MQQTYIQFVCETLQCAAVGAPIYIRSVADKLAAAYGLAYKEAAAATAVAFQRIMAAKTMPDLRFYQKGIYYRATVTLFGETGINTEQLIADKYLLPNMGYETGLTVLHHMGLTTQIPRERTLVSNAVKTSVKNDTKLGVTIRPPRVPVTAENKEYLRTLDVLDNLKNAPIDTAQPYRIVAEHIQQHGLKYDTLLALGDKYYNRNTVLQLAHVASFGGEQ